MTVYRKYIQLCGSKSAHFNFKTMNIRVEKGCYNKTLYINDVEVNESTNKEFLNVVIDLIINNVKKEGLISLIYDLMEFYGWSEVDKDPCDQCGNWGETITLEV